MSATSKHYTALYNVVTDLLIYQDPQHRHRSDRVDSFMFAFDRKDRDPQRLVLDLFGLQQSIRSLVSFQRGYEANLDLLTDQGRSELFKIRTDLLEATEQLFMIFEAIAVNHARDDARAALKSAARLDVRAGRIAWHMLHDDLTPLIKLDIMGTLHSYLSNKDGSTDSALAIGDLSALNSNADALYPEVMVRYESSASGRKRSVSLSSVLHLTIAETTIRLGVLVVPRPGRRHRHHPSLCIHYTSCPVQARGAIRSRDCRLHLQRSCEAAQAA